MKKNIVWGVKLFSSLMLAAALVVSPVTSALPQTSSGTIVFAGDNDFSWSTYSKKDSSWWKSSEATKLADEIVKYQLSDGGWRKDMKTSTSGSWNKSTIDNNATWGQIRFLANVYTATKNDKYRQSCLKGINLLINGQYSNGGWPQVFNDAGTYHAHITYNDNAMVNVLKIMQEMYQKTGAFAWIDSSYQKKAENALDKGIQCILNTQITVNGTLTAWCQQHNEYTLAPDYARAYELPSICSSESAAIATFLRSLPSEKQSSAVIKAHNAAVKWFDQVKIENKKWDWNKDKTDKVVTTSNGSTIWARFYNLNTNKPLFADRDGKAYDDVTKISQERRTGYAWYGNWGKNVIGLSPLPTDGQISQTTEPQPEEPEYAGEFIKKLTVHDVTNGGNWSIEEELGVGAKIFGDRDFTYVIVPNELTGAEYIRPACNSKTYRDDLAALTAAVPLTVYVMVDTRLSMEQGITPRWLSGWTRTGLVAVSSNTETFEIFSKDMDADETLTLGSNMTGTGVVNYTAAVVPRAVVPETTTAAITTESTAEEITAGKFGDVDCNGSVAIADAVLLARYIAEDAVTVTGQGLRNAEMDGQIGLTSGDLSILLQYLAGNVRIMTN